MSWRGQVIAPGAHPDAPWWSRDMSHPWRLWLRRDGLHLRVGRDLKSASDADILPHLAAFDTADPLAPPDAHGGQVWAFDDESENMVIGLAKAGGPVGQRVVWAVAGIPPTVWPPADAALVAGPGAPWESM